MFWILLMNIVPVRELKIEDRQTAMRRYVMVNCQRKMKTEPNQSSSSKKNPSLRRLPSIQKTPHFEVIFKKCKRSQYSGYKQCSLGRGKSDDLQKESTKLSQHKPARNYQANAKNIAKLRRRSHFQIKFPNPSAAEDGESPKTKEAHKIANISLELIGLEEKRHHILTELLKSSKQKKSNLYGRFDKKCLPTINTKSQRQLIRVIDSDSEFSRYRVETEREKRSKNDLAGTIMDEESQLIELKPIKSNLNPFAYRQDSRRLILKKQHEPEDGQLSGWESQTFLEQKGKHQNYNDYSLRLHDYRK